ncbi:MAG TPA: alpha/beta hydrolase [Telluria sp.]|nr:alpha/beta hydrolase [Telluria sp.]
MSRTLTTRYFTESPRLPRWSGPALLATALGASFLFVLAKTRQAERENPPRGKFVEVDGIQLHYMEYGDGPPVVMLHGNGISANDLEASGLVERVAEHHRVIVFDRPGYGYSDRPRTTIWTPHAQAELLYRALEQMGIEHPVVLGHSWGTMVALSMGLAHPEYVRGLVLLSGYYYPSVRLDVPMLSPPAIPIIGDLMRYTISPLLGRMMWPGMSKRMFSPVPISWRFRRLPVWFMLRPSQLRAGAAESALMIPSVIALKKHYAELSVPVAVFAGSGDKVVSPNHNSIRFHGEVPQSTLRIEPAVGHMIHYASPDAITKAIGSFSVTVAPTARPQPALEQ